MIAKSILEEARTFMEESSNKKIVKHIEALVRQNEDWRPQKCLNLDAGESMQSPAVRRIQQSDLERRGLVGEIGSRISGGARYLDQIQALTEELCKKLFRVNYVEYRPITTSMCDALAIRCLTEVGDKIMALEVPRGHPTWREVGYAGFRGLQIFDIPFDYDYDKWNVDIDGLARVAEEVRPKLMIIGFSYFLFPHRLKRIREIADEMNSRIWYDGAHILGLMAGGKFQDPIREGADMVTGSAHKTFSGPIGGIMLYEDEEVYKKLHSIFYGHLGTIMQNRMAALAVSFVEWLEFGRDFADQIIRNAKALAKELDDKGFNVFGKQRGYTKSHIVLSDVREIGGGISVVKKLERANIMCLHFKIRPTDEGRYGIRFGTTEMTRYGMREPEMKSIAEFIRRVVIDDERPEKIANEVAEFRGLFKEIHYGFG